MKRIALIITGAAILVTFTLRPGAQDNRTSVPMEFRVGEYATVRFMEERTSIVWPDGRVENVMDLAPTKKFEGGEKYPKGSDYRMYWLTIAMNHLAKNGFELAQMNDRDVVMVRRYKKS